MDRSDIVISPESETTPAVEVLGSDSAREFIRYTAASAIALIVDAGALALLTSGFGVSYLLSGAIAFTLGVLLVYILSITWVFEKRAVHAWAMEFLLFVCIGVIGLAINEGFLWFFTGMLGLYYLLSKALSVVAVFLWNFFVRKYLLFGTRHG